MAEIKVFEMNDYDWWAGEDLASVTAEYVKEVGGDVDLLDDPQELADEDLDRLKFTKTDEDDDRIGVCTFRERLNEMVADGVPFPCFFATTEW